MAEYVDAVATFLKDDGSMVLLQFLQVVPYVEESGEIKTRQELSGSVLMNAKLAKEFASGLVKQISKESEKLSEDNGSAEEN